MEDVEEQINRDKNDNNAPLSRNIIDDDNNNDNDNYDDDDGKKRFWFRRKWKKRLIKWKNNWLLTPKY